MLLDPRSLRSHILLEMGPVQTQMNKLSWQYLMLAEVSAPKRFPGHPFAKKMAGAGKGFPAVCRTVRMARPTQHCHPADAR